MTEYEIWMAAQQVHGRLAIAALHRPLSNVACTGKAACQFPPKAFFKWQLYAAIEGQWPIKGL
jgi:hypothetical protein